MKPILAEYEARIAAWVNTQPVIRAMLVVGSTQRRVNPADEWSDLDLALYVTDFSTFTENLQWLKGFGPLWTVLQLLEEGPVFLAVYDGAEKVDFHLYSVADLEKLVIGKQLPDGGERGYRIVIDKDSLAAKLPEASQTQTASAVPRQAVKPTSAAFSKEIHRFWYGALYTAKQIRRQNLWAVKVADGRVKQSLLQILEWYAQSQHDWALETWHDGHFMAQWSDSNTLEAVQHIFGHFNAEDSWHALFSTMALFRQRSQGLAQDLGEFYPTDLDNNCTTYINALYLEKD